MDTNTLNLDPDPGLCHQFWKNKLKIILEKKFTFKKSIFLTTIRKKFHLKQIFIQMSLWIVNLLNRSPCYSSFSYVNMCGSGSVIRKAPDYGSNSIQIHWKKYATAMDDDLNPHYGIPPGSGCYFQK